MRKLAIAMMLVLVPVGAPGQVVDPPAVLDLQGQVRTAGGQPLNGNVSMTFSIYGSAAGGAALYTETQEAVQVSGGRFAVFVGGITPIPPGLFETHSTLYVGVSVNGGAELPRQQLVTVPWAFVAKSAVVASTARDLDCTGCVSEGAMANGAVAGPAIRDAAVTGAKIGTGAVDTWKVADGSLTELDLANGACSRDKIAFGAVDSSKIQDGGVYTADIADRAVTEEKVDFPWAAGVTAGGAARDLACSGCVSGTEVEAGAVTADKVGEVCDVGDVLKSAGPGLWTCGPDDDHTYTNGPGLLLANGSFALDTSTTDMLYVNEGQAASVSSSMLQAAAVGQEHIQAGAVTTAGIMDRAVTTAKLMEQAVTAAKIAAGAVLAEHIGVGAVTTDKIATDAVTAAKIATGAVGADEIATDAVTAAKIAAGAVGTPELADGAVTAPKIGVSCAEGQVLVRAGGSWACGYAGDRLGAAAVSDTGWFPYPFRFAQRFEADSSADFLLPWGRVEWDIGGRVTVPMMASVHYPVGPGYVAWSGGQASVIGWDYMLQINSLGDRNNLSPVSGMGRLVGVKVPAGTQKYDSGWFSCSVAGGGTTYTYNHNLGVVPEIAWMEIAQTNTGGGWRVPSMTSSTIGNAWRQASVVELSATQVKVRTHGSSLAYFTDASGTQVAPDTAYCRVVVAKWTPDYDSGWVGISTAAGNREKYFRHKLGRFPTFVMVWVGQNSTGTGWVTPAMGHYHGSHTNGTGVYDVGDEWIVVKGGSSNIAYFYNSAGTNVNAASGYVRVMAWK